MQKREMVQEPYWLCRLCGWFIPIENAKVVREINCFHVICEFEGRMHEVVAGRQRVVVERKLKITGMGFSRFEGKNLKAQIKEQEREQANIESPAIEV
jgi:hypothetical protein